MKTWKIFSGVFPLRFSIAFFPGLYVALPSIMQKRILPHLQRFHKNCCWMLLVAHAIVACEFRHSKILEKSPQSIVETIAAIAYSIIFHHIPMPFDPESQSHARFTTSKVKSD